MDLKWVHSIFVVSMSDELDQLTKMQIDRVRVRLRCQCLVLKSVFGHVFGYMITQEGQ